MYTQALRARVYISGKSQGHVIQLICAMQANSLGTIYHPFQFKADHWIRYIDQLVKFDCGKAKTTL